MSELRLKASYVKRAREKCVNQIYGIKYIRKPPSHNRGFSGSLNPVLHSKNDDFHPLERGSSGRIVTKPVMIVNVSKLVLKGFRGSLIRNTVLYFQTFHLSHLDGEDGRGKGVGIS